MRLNNIKEIKGIMKLKTGTRVGGSTENIEIGGNDNPVIRNPYTGEVYIPGSSLKGKMRSLTEWLEGAVPPSGKVHSCSDPKCPVCRTFGRGAEDSKRAKSGPTRLIVRDAYLTEESKKELTNLKARTGMDTEMKFENTINRLSSEANPRNLERIPAGMEFEFNMSYKVFDLEDGFDEEENFEKIVLKGLKALLLEGVGGGVSRGNGQIEFTFLSVDGKDYLGKMEEIDV
ncbi:type III-A CRISPR-associated RAMP protein Csm3 [uncultured Ilyobacter sp.]|uniref:type III-A CRISPR-associated RAMP protein Csm3 n=1 Tax=uncultured Ilyobacter sp. TaxID=544433 RepID=UPI0029C73909|nr:type III-A CRISPR-associated RAMP protein Csm3 [uncultured Ilyobacter sp.]